MEDELNTYGPNPSEIDKVPAKCIFNRNLSCPGACVAHPTAVLFDEHADELGLNDRSDNNPKNVVFNRLIVGYDIKLSDCFNFPKDDL